MIQRHSKGAIFMHWFNAVCWITLLLSGFGLINNNELQPVGMWYVDFWHALLAPQNILVLHVTLGVVWVAVYAVYILARFNREAMPFLREISTFNPRSDMVWLFRKVLHLTVGEKIMRQKGMATDLPPQGFYNAGQKMFAVPAVLCSLGLIATGGSCSFRAAGSMVPPLFNGPSHSIFSAPPLWRWDCRYTSTWRPSPPAKVPPSVPCSQGLSLRNSPSTTIRCGTIKL